MTIRVDRDAAPLVDGEHDLHVAVGELLHLGGDLDLEVALVLVVVLQLLLGSLHLHRVVDAAQLEVDLVLQRRWSSCLLPTNSTSRTKGRSTTTNVTLTPPSKSSTASWTSSKKPRREDGPEILGEREGLKALPSRALDPAEDHRLLDPAVALDGELLDDDRAGLGRAARGGGRDEAAPEQNEGERRDTARGLVGTGALRP